MAKKKAPASRRPAEGECLRDPGDSIEGEKIEVSGRKIMPVGRPSMEAGKMFFGIEVRKGGRGEVIKAFREKDAKPVVNRNSAITKGAMIAGDHLAGRSCKPFRKDSQNIGGAGRTHTHSGQNWMMEKCCFLEVVRNFLKEVAAQQKALSPAPVVAQIQSTMV